MQSTRFTDFGSRVSSYSTQCRDRPAAVTIPEIATRFDSSRNHSVKVVHFMSQRGWVSTTRGKGGGSASAHQRAVSDYCQAHSGDKIGLEDSARSCGSSRYQFSRRFASSVGSTPHAWSTRSRSERACGASARARAPIGQGGADVGFYGQSHFNRAFRTACGVPPSAYRRAT
ncbi:hypothetical protein OY671_009084 [Metschnikowia pulcherrima]|nr:hypothetical protein OY671_009084 [Metschnikowia pulcherrima]